MRKPNFFILGAPKCGTTSMALWLANHPQVFMSKPKEPNYYNTDHNNGVTLYKDYLALFKEANEVHRIVGEASPMYLCSAKAMSNIRNDTEKESVKFLVMIRNPIEMAYSFHEQLVYNLDEPIKNFKTAWYLQEERKNAKKLGMMTREPKYLLYGEVCKLGKQLQNVYKFASRNEVKVVLLDDIKKDVKKEYNGILSFLGVDIDSRTDFKPVNESKLRKNNAIASAIKVSSLIKQKLGISHGLGILNKVSSINTKPNKREKLDVGFENELKEFFYDDVKLLSEIIGRDVTYWVR